MKLVLTLLLGVLPLIHGSCVTYNGPPVEVICENTTMTTALSFLPSNVQKLTIKGSNLQTLNANGFANLSLNQLTDLHLMNNEITSIQNDAFAGLPSLEILDLSGNLMPDLPETSLTGIAALKALNLADNKLETVPKLSSVPSLLVLDLNSNLLSLLPCDAFDTVEDLNVLYIERNQITTLLNCSLQGLRNLEELSFRWNPIENIGIETFAETPSLKRLDFSFTKLVTLPERVLEPVGGTLLSVTFANSNLASVPRWGNLTRLQHLDMTANELVSIETGAFDTVDNLEGLYVVDMVTLKSIASGAFQNLGKLRTLVINGNKNLKAFPADVVTPDLRNLEQLRLNNNGIQKFTKELLQTLESMPALRIVTIEDNPIHCDCSAEVLREFILSSEVSWAQDWNSGGIKCSTPVNFKGMGLVAVPPRDLTCEAPTVVVDSLDVRVEAGSPLEVSVLAYGGIPSSVWITPQGVTLKPNEEKLGFTVREVIADNNVVTTTILKESFTRDDGGPFTVVVTNANSGTSTTLRVTTAPRRNETEDVVTQTPETASAPGDGVLMLSANMKAANKDDNRPHTTTPKIDIEKQHEQERAHRNLIGIFVAMFMFMVAVLFVFAIVRKRKRDVLYHRLPTSRTAFYLIRRRDYGTCKPSRV